jgi:hypothetical protein
MAAYSHFARRSRVISRHISSGLAVVVLVLRDAVARSNATLNADKRVQQMIGNRLSGGFVSAICVGSNISDGASMAPNRSKQNSNDKRVFCEQSRSAIEAPAGTSAV